MRIPTESLLKILSDAGLISSRGGRSNAVFDVARPSKWSQSANLLEVAKHICRSSEVSKPGSADSIRATRVDKLNEYIRLGRRLTLVNPFAASCADASRADIIAEQTGQRLWWWTPREGQLDPRIAVLSSRLGRLEASLAPWLLTLRRLSCQASERGEALLSVAGTTAHPWIERCSALFDVPWLPIQVARSTIASTSSWLRRVANWNERGPPANDYWHLSPPLTPCGDVRRNRSEDWNADALLALLAHRIYVLRLRRGGRVWNVLRRVLRTAAGPERQPATTLNTNVEVILAIGGGLVTETDAAELIARGARAWRPDVETTRPLNKLVDDAIPASAEADVVGPTSNLAGEQTHLDCGRGVDEIGSRRPELWRGMLRGGEWLIHCTRRRDGPWPDQTPTDYHDEWLLRPDRVETSAESVLRRIVRQRRLIASSREIRGGYPVVAFTAVAAADLVGLRVYRRHRRRWDFEPYGLAIRRSWLETQGARPVRYGDDTLWTRLAQTERPFFQRRFTRRPNASEEVIDWQIEQEWRILGDLVLPVDVDGTVVVLVPSEQVAERLSPVSLWPFSVLAPFD